MICLCGAYDLFSREIVAPQSNNTLIIYSSSLFFKMILIIYLHVFLGLGSFGQLGLAPGSESISFKTLDDSIVCRRPLISKVQVLGSLA
jgi:hypothetical protein